MDRSDFLRYRQVHLDYHTSEQITNIGADFDAAPETAHGHFGRARQNVQLDFGRYPQVVADVDVVERSAVRGRFVRFQTPHGIL